MMNGTDTNLPAYWPRLLIVPWTLHTLHRPQYDIQLKQPATFTTDGLHGVHLKPAFPYRQRRVDNGEELIFEGCAEKITYVIQLDGYSPFKLQKYAYTSRRGHKVPRNKAQVLKQVAEVMEAFIKAKEREQCDGPCKFGAGGIQLEDLYLLELWHVSKSSFQPVFAIKGPQALTMDSRAVLTPYGSLADHYSPTARGSDVLQGSVEENMDEYYSWG